MAKSSAEKSVRRNLTFPPSFIKKIETLKRKRGGVSDSEILRQAVTLLEAATDPNVTVTLRDKAGKETRIMVP
jgi:hypothetical protein